MRYTPILIAAMLALAPAAPALAQAPAAIAQTVTAERGVLSPAQVADLEAGLARLRPYKVHVVIANSLPGGAESAAKALYRDHRLGADGVAIAIAVADRQVSAHAGQALTDRGLDRAAIVDVIGSNFKAYARAGEYDRGALSLAQGLVAYGSSQPVRRRSGGGGGGVFWLFLLFAGGGGLLLWWLARKPKAGVPTQAERVAALQADRGRIADLLLQVDDASTQAGIGAQDPLSEAGVSLMGEAKAFGDAVDALTPTSRQDLDGLELTAINLEVGFAALLTAYRADRRGEDAGAAIVNRAFGNARRWKTLDLQSQALRDAGRLPRAEATVNADRLQRARRALATVPVQEAEANRLMDEVQASLAPLAQLPEPQTRVVESYDAGYRGWDPTPIYLGSLLLDAASHHHHHDPYDASSSSGWGGDSGSSSWDDDNRNAGSSWGDSGSSSWDSGGGSSDSGSSGSDSW